MSTFEKDDIPDDGMYLVRVVGEPSGILVPEGGFRFALDLFDYFSRIRFNSVLDGSPSVPEFIIENFKDGHWWRWREDSARGSLTPDLKWVYLSDRQLG